MARCSHGEFEDAPVGHKRVHGSVAKASTEHQRKCPGADIFFHHGWVFTLMCCGTCGRKLASF